MSRRLDIQLASSPYRRGLAALAAAAVVSAGLAGTAGAQNAPRCGQVLTASVTLQTDLTNCPGDGLVIGASRVVLI